MTRNLRKRRINKQKLKESSAMRFILAVSIATVIFSGCAPSQERLNAIRKWESDAIAKVERYCWRLNQDGKTEFEKAIWAKKIVIGMSRNDVCMALRLTGSEDKGNLKTSSLSPGSNGYSEEITVNRTVNRFGTSMQWVMPQRNFSGPKYIYFDDNFLTTWQD